MIANGGDGGDVSRHSSPSFGICDLSELHLTHPDKSDKVRICAGMSEDALDYVAAVIRREASKV